jgi:broad specificity phosphatase PhoE
MVDPRMIRLCAVLLGLAALAGCASGLQGMTYTRSPGAAIGAALPDLALSFVKEDGSAKVDTRSDAAGRYRVNLAPGRWTALAMHAQREDTHSAPGFFVVRANAFGTGNFFLREPQMTTVLIVRHAEKQDPNSNAASEPLSAAGADRARRLGELLARAGVTAVYSTDTVRTRSTVQPAADRYRLPTRIYTTPAALAASVLAEQHGDVVLVAAHSDTVAQVINAFGAAVPAAGIGDFDNLYVLTVGGAHVSVTNLQYGVDSTPDSAKNQRQAMTLLLVGLGDAQSAPDAQRLTHAARKAGVSAIFASAANPPLLAPLATALSIAPTVYDGSNLPALASTLRQSFAAATVVVAGSHDQLRALVRALDAEPFPILYPPDRDHLLVLTRLPSGATRLVPLRF